MSFARKIASFNAAFIACIALALIPIWSCANLPFVDYPQHLGIVHILNRYHDPAALYSRFFELKFFPRTNILHALLIHWFSYAVPLETAGKIFLSLYAILLPVSILMLIRALNGNRWMSLLSFLLVYNYNMMWGFIGYCFGTALFFATFALMLRHLSGEGRKWIPPAIAALCILVFLAHPQAYGFLLVTLIVSAAICGGGLRDMLKKCAVIIPSFVFLVPWVCSFIAERRGSLGGDLGAAFASPANSLRIKAADLLGNLTARLFYSDIVLAVLLVALIYLFVRGFGRDLFADKKFRAVLVMAALSVTVYFAAPLEFGGYHVVYPRFALLAVLLFAGLASRVSIPGERALRAALAMAILICCVETMAAFARFDRMAQPARELIAQAEPHGKMVELYYRGTFPRPVSYPAFLHFACYYQTQKDGLAGFIFPHFNRWHIVRLKKNYVSKRIDEWRASRSIFPGGWQEFDYFLLCGSPPRSEARYLEQLEFVGRKGIWTLLKNKHPAS